MSIADRDKRLGSFFSSEQLSELDNSQKEVLNEEFANSELRVLSSQDMKTIHARLGVHLQAENHRRLNQIQPEEYEFLKDWYVENSHTVSELYCSKCDALLAVEVDTIDDNMNPSHHEGKFIVPIGDKLMAYRPRLDGVMGFQCGNIVENQEAKYDWEQFDTDQKAYDKELKHWDSLTEKTRAKREAPVAPTPPEEPRNVECGNNTLWAQIELNNVPDSHIMTSVTKDDRIKVKQEMNATDYAPDVKETKTGKSIETFELRKVK